MVRHLGTVVVMKASISRKHSGSAKVKDPAAWLGRVETDLLLTLAIETQDDMRESLGSPGPQNPSLPGETPNRQTDDLHDHILAEVKGSHTTAVEVTRPSGNPNVPEWLENGTPGGRMAARPFVTPAYERMLLRFEETAKRVAKETP